MNEAYTTRYSVAIRTLGLNPEVLRQELESVYAQTIRPEKVVIYIARGYKVPDFRVGDEIYVPTQKGMVAQRAMPYSEMDSPLILWLDDDVRLSPDSAERLIDALHSHDLDCVAADTFANHRLTALKKAYAALTNLTLPHHSGRYAFKVHSNGSFSYLSSPKADVYPSQSAAGPCSLWKKRSLTECRFADEVWLDQLGFAYNDDGLEFYKLYINGGKLGVHFGAGVHNINAQTSSGDFHRDPKVLYKRSKAQYLVWHRSIYSWRKSRASKIKAVSSYALKVLWQVPIHLIAAVRYRDIKAPYHLIRGTIDGIKYTHTPQYKNLPDYLL